jgi:hypothetical protein
MSGMIGGMRVWQTGTARVPSSFHAPGGGPPGSFVRHFWPIVSSLEDLYWTSSLLDTLRDHTDPDVVGMLQLLPPDAWVPPKTVFPEFAYAVGGGWTDFYGFTQPPQWPHSQWPLRCRGETMDEAVSIAFRCFEGDCWTMHSRDERVLGRMREAPLRAPYLVVKDVEGLPLCRDRIILFPRPAEE